MMELIRKAFRAGCWGSLVLAGLLALNGCKGCTTNKYKGKRVLRVPVQADVGGMDPLLLGSLYDSATSAQVIEPLLEYNYVARPYKIQPLLVKEMPTVSKDGLTYTFELKKGILFHDNECFQGGKGRELVAKDVLYSYKRLAFRDHDPPPRSWWVFDKRIAGLNKFREEQHKRVEAGKAFAFDAPVEGLKELGKYKFQIKLAKRFPQFLYILAFQRTGIVPRECVEYYSKNNRGGLTQHPVGTGPYVFKKWIKGVRIVFERNKNYKHSVFPTTGFGKQDIKEGLDKSKGEALPQSDVLIIHIFQKYQPSWLKFRRGALDYITVGTEVFDNVYNKDLTLKPTFAKKGIESKIIKLMDFIYTGFNFKDKLVGGYGEKARYLRKALAYTIDYDEINRRFYNSRVHIYLGAIPPGMKGHAGARFKPDLKKAKEYLAKAGYPNGKGLPTLVISTSNNGQAKEREDVIKRQFARIGVKVRYELSTFPQLSTKLRTGQIQMFSLAWSSDYPDAENNLMLFWGKNAAPGPNSWNYANPEYDKLFEEARLMDDSPERTAKYKKMNRILIDDVVFLGSMARRRYYLRSKQLQNFKPDELMGSYWKFLAVPKSK